MFSFTTIKSDLYQVLRESFVCFYLPSIKHLVKRTNQIVLTLIVAQVSMTAMRTIISIPFSNV